jgi:hypothetical protein
MMRAIGTKQFRTIRVFQSMNTASYSAMIIATAHMYWGCSVNLQTYFFDNNQIVSGVPENPKRNYVK